MTGKEKPQRCKLGDYSAKENGYYCITCEKYHGADANRHPILPDKSQCTCTNATTCAKCAIENAETLLPTIAKARAGFRELPVPNMIPMVQCECLWEVIQPASKGKYSIECPNCGKLVCFEVVDDEGGAEPEPEEE